VLFHYFDGFLAEYESRFEKDYGFSRPIVKQVTVRIMASTPMPNFHQPAQADLCRGQAPASSDRVSRSLGGS
jgi:hypothetical protein